MAYEVPVLLFPADVGGDAGMLLADVHTGNISQPKPDSRPFDWVITDPGHLMMLEE